MREYPGRLHHKTPAGVKDGAIFHIHIRALPTQSPPLTAPVLAPRLIAAARRAHELGHWWCELFLLMPDHIHALLAFHDSLGMSETIRNWKRGAARVQRVLWQEGYFDHRLRPQKSLRESWDYIHRNPVVKNLCAIEEDWPWWWSGTAVSPAAECTPSPLTAK